MLACTYMGVQQSGNVVGGLWVEVVGLCACVLYFLCNTLITTLSSLPSSPLPTSSLLHCCHRIWDCPLQDRSVQQSVWDVWVYPLLYIWWTYVSEVLCNCYVDTAEKLSIFFVCVWESQTTPVWKCPKTQFWGPLSNWKFKSWYWRALSFQLVMSHLWSGQVPFASPYTYLWLIACGNDIVIISITTRSSVSQSLRAEMLLLGARYCNNEYKYSQIKLCEAQGMLK